MENMDNILQTLVDFATTDGIKVVGAVLTLIVGRIVAGWARKLVNKALGKTNVDEAIRKFLASMAYYMVIIFTVISALTKFGVETASLVAVLGAAGTSSSSCRGKRPPSSTRAICLGSCVFQSVASKN